MDQQLVVVTYNVWFSSRQFQERSLAILRILEQSNADFICLQEVLLEFVVLLTQHNQLARDYIISTTTKWKTSYGVVILAKRELQASFSYYDLPTTFGRTLVVAEACIQLPTCKPVTVRVATAHFESMANQLLRQEQLQIAAQVLNQPAKTGGCAVEAILCGDFNFCSYRNFSGQGELENNCLRRILPNFIDVWPALKSAADHGYTFDSLRNWNIGKHEQMRYDRVLSQLRYLTPTDITLLGTDPIAPAVDIQSTHKKDAPMPPLRPSKKQTRGPESTINSSSSGSSASSAGTPCTPPPARESGEHIHSTAGDGSATAGGTPPQQKLSLQWNTTTPPKTSGLWPSDHFGLRAVFELNALVGSAMTTAVTTIEYVDAGTEGNG
jgi:endonuclease/exonuclease/phosphatase family metal-dependent hydrolase